MYDMDKIHALPGQSPETPADATVVEFIDDDYPDESVNIATEIPQTTTAYGHTISRYGSDIGRKEVERYLSWCVEPR